MPQSALFQRDNIYHLEIEIEIGSCGLLTLTSFTLNPNLSVNWSSPSVADAP